MEYTIKKSAKQFFQLWMERIKVEDSRSGKKEHVRGFLVGITEDEVLIRVSGGDKTWFPYRDENVKFLLIS